MIFVTVGDQLPFDRLIKVIDRWTGETGRQDVFAQIGKASFYPQNMNYCNFCSIKEYRQSISSADLVIGHAGIGTILSAMEYGKLVLVMPRAVTLGEVTNNHQLATANRFLRMPFVEVAFDEVELVEKLNRIEKVIIIGKKSQFINSTVSSELLQTLRDFVSS